MLITTLALPLGIARDVYVEGYYRQDGTYVRPHYRSAPDGVNNYGSSRNSYELLNPRLRDNDGDGSPNYLDLNDGNDGLFNSYDIYQYGILR